MTPSPLPLAKMPLETLTGRLNVLIRPAFLIVDEIGNTSLTPYWAPLAAINEQVRGSQDPWVVWVRRQLAAKQ